MHQISFCKLLTRFVGATLSSSGARPWIAPLLRSGMGVTYRALPLPVPTNSGLALLTSLRWSTTSTIPTTTTSTTPSTSAASLSQASASDAKSSAVNLDEFTLNEEVVQRDLDNLSQWNSLSEAIELARSSKNHCQLLEEVSRGLSMLEKLGPLNAPIQCEALLYMEAAQAHYNLKQYDDALKSAHQARESLMAHPKPEQRDMAQIGEINQLIGYILLAMGNVREAHRVFTDLLRWIDVDAKSASPIQAVSAVNLRRTVLSGLGEALCAQAQAQQLEDAGLGEPRSLYSKALDILIEALNQHIDERDFELVKRTLRFILTCFEGLSDVQQAVSTCRKYISWCSRYEDEAGVLEGKRILSDLCRRRQIPNPLEPEESQETTKP